MTMKVTKIDVLNLAGQIINGIFSNPSAGNVLYDQYQRQQIIQNAINDTQQAFIVVGIEIIDDE